MSRDTTQLLLLVATWLAYFSIHSILASHAIKKTVHRRWPRFASAYRLIYNALALVLLVPPLWLTYALDASVLWTWRGWEKLLMDGFAILALVGFLFTLKGYDGMDFLGLSQLRAKPAGPPLETGRFTLSWFHRFVRHPWYSFALVVIWTRDMNLPFLITAILVTAYFVIGSKLEERKLIVTFGNVYRDYQTRVPGLIPRPWRYLTKEQAKELLAKSNEA